MALCVTLSLSVRWKCILGKLPYCSVMLRMTCLNSRKRSEFHSKKAVSICHKSCQQCSSTQKMANLPLDVLEQFLPLSNYFPFRCITAGLCSPVPLQMAPSRCLRLLSWGKDHAVIVWGSWRGCHRPGCLHGNRAEHLCCRGELWHSWMCQTLFLHLVQKVVTYLSQGHQCPTLPDASHQRELRNSAVINNLIYPLELIFFPPFLILCSAYQLLLLIKKTNPL